MMMIIITIKMKIIPPSEKIDDDHDHHHYNLQMTLIDLRRFGYRFTILRLLFSEGG